MTEPRIHSLKTQPPYFDDVQQGRKNFEVRLNDRGFEVGDILLLREWSGEYTGKSIQRRVSYILSQCPVGNIPDGVVVMGLEPIGRAKQ